MKGNIEVSGKESWRIKNVESVIVKLIYILEVIE